jgi:hypothetical protein
MTVFKAQDVKTELSIVYCREVRLHRAPRNAAQNYVSTDSAVKTYWRGNKNGEPPSEAAPDAVSMAPGE